MTPTEQELAMALRRRLEIIGDKALRDSNPQQQLAQLREVSEKIDQLQASLPPDTDGRLRHFLERCSYDKALAWLEGGEG